MLHALWPSAGWPANRVVKHRAMPLASGASRRFAQSIAGTFERVTRVRDDTVGITRRMMDVLSNPGQSVAQSVGEMQSTHDAIFYIYMIYENK